MVALASACETVQQTATSPEYHKTRTGAGIGAAAGAVIGLLTRGDKFQNALIGAAIGGIAGGAIGNYQDRQEDSSCARACGIGRPGRPSGQQHHTGHARQHHLRQQQCRRERGFLPDPRQGQHDPGPYDQTMVEVAGHTDSTGSAPYNQALSERRAKSVAAYLTSRGLRGERLMVVGDGENHPIASN